MTQLKRLLALCICLSATLVSFADTEYVTFANVKFSVDTTQGWAVVFGPVNESVTEISIPVEVNSSVGYVPVISIKTAAFKNCVNLKTVGFSKNKYTKLTYVGNEAFYGCNNLSDITLPDCVEQIGASAFEGCQSLKTFLLPESLKSISSRLFWGCTSLEDITLPGSVTSIGDEAFYYCNLTSVVLPPTLKSIGDKAFKQTRLSSIIIPSATKTLGAEVFAYTPLASVTIHDGCTFIPEKAFYYCLSLKSVKLPNTLETIGVHAFGSCKLLQEITLPSTLKSIGESAFEYCALNHIEIPEGVERVENNTFLECPLMFVTLPNSLTYIGDLAFDRFEGTTFTVPASVTHIGKSALHMNEGQLFLLPTTPPTLGFNALADCECNKYVPFSAYQDYLDNSAYKSYEPFSTIKGVCSKPKITQVGEGYQITSNSPKTDFHFILGSTLPELLQDGDTFSIPTSINLYIYAKKSDMANSEPLILTIPLGGGADVNNDGNIDIQDVTKLIDTILKKDK